MSKQAYFFKNLGIRAYDEGEFKKALEYFDKCEKTYDIVYTNYEKGQCYMGLHEYEKAINAFNNAYSSDAYFQIGKCYEKLNKKEEAVKFYKLADTDESLKIYNKLNPLKRRVLYYQTVCCDGVWSPSNAKGRGACSHHGGFCDWNYPVCEEYKEFQ